jgi:hypothetical protein
MVTTRGNTYEEEEIETERPADMITEVSNPSTPGTHRSDTPPSSTTSEISALVNLLRCLVASEDETAPLPEFHGW